MKSSNPSADDGGAQDPSANVPDPIESALSVAEAALQYGVPDRAEELLVELQAQASAVGSPKRAEVEYRLGKLAASQGRSDIATAWFEVALKSARVLADKRSEAYALNGLAVISQRQGHLGGADRLWETTVRLSEACGDDRLVAMASQNRGVLANMRGDFGLALTHYRTSLRAFEKSEDDQGVAWVANNLGLVYKDLRRFHEALGMFRLARERAESAGDLELQGLAFGNRAATLVAMRLPSAAHEPAVTALRIATQRKDKLREAEALRVLGTIRLREGDPEAAELNLTRARELAASTSDRLLHAEVLGEMAELHHSQGLTEQAESAWVEAEAMYRDIGALLNAEDLAERRRQCIGSAPHCTP